MEQILEFIANYWKAAFEIVLLAAVIYYFLMLFRGTRGAAVLTGFVIVLLGVAGLTQVFQLDVINWILGRFFAFLAIAIVVIFQPELRRALAQLGSQNPFTSSRLRFELIDVLVETARLLSHRRCGGLMAVEREIGFRGLAETGVSVEAKATPELLTTIFFPNSPLHDGGVVLRGDRISAAACVFPLTQRQGLSASMGMRHRAAIGLTEETDAIVVVVSEETGEVSVAHRGNLFQGLDPDALRDFLSTTLAPSARKGDLGLTDYLRRTLGSLFVRGSTGDLAEPSRSDAEEPGAGSRPAPRGDQVVIQWFSSNAGLKIVALLLATATWFFVRSATSDWRIIEGVPLEIKTQPGVSVLESSATTVNVMVRGTREDVQQVSRQELSAVVDLTGDERRGEWTVRLEPKIIRHSRRVRVTQVTPAEFQVSVDAVIERDLTVKAQLAGEPAPGFVTERVLVKPEVVRLKGPQTVLEALAVAPTLPVDVAGRRTSFRERVELAPVLPASMEKRRWVEVDVRIGPGTPAENHTNSPAGGQP